MITEPWATLQEVAEHRKVSEDTVHRWIANVVTSWDAICEASRQVGHTGEQMHLFTE